MNYEVTIIVPTYNRADLIVPTLESLLSQSLTPAEVIVVDDGSSDDTEAIVRRFGGIVKYHRIQNSGECVARNVGVSMATSPWLAFCDSDDLWRPTKLEYQMRAHAMAPEVQYSFTNFVHVVDEKWASVDKFSYAPKGFWGDGRRAIDDHVWIYDKPLYSRILRFTPIFPSTLVMTKDFFRRVGGFDERFTRVRSVDLEFTLRCLQETPIAALATPLVGIRKHAGNFSGDRLTCLQGEVQILRHARARHRLGNDCLDIIDDEIAARTRQAAELAFGGRDMALARKLGASVPRRHRSWRFAMKMGIAALPRPLAHAAGASAEKAAALFAQDRSASLRGGDAGE